MSDKQISIECSEGRHEECKETLESCQCTFRGSHTTQHAYATMSDKNVSIADGSRIKRWKWMKNDEGTFYMERCDSGDWVSYKEHLFTLIAAEDRIRELEQALQKQVDAYGHTNHSDWIDARRLLSREEKP